MKVCLLPVLAGADAADLIQKIHVPGTTSKLAVGHALQADVLLHSHDLADGLIFDASTLFRADTPLRVLVSCLEELLRSKKTSNVLCMERRRVSHRF